MLMLANPQISQKVMNVQWSASLDRLPVRATQRTVQTTAKASQQAVQTAHATVKTTAVTAKAAVKATTTALKAAVSAVQELAAAIAAGSWIVVAIVLLICMAGLLIASPFGVLFMDDSSVSSTNSQEMEQRESWNVSILDRCCCGW